MKSFVEILQSFLYYVAFYAVALALFYCAEQKYRSEQNKRANIFMFFGIIVLAVFAGLRSDSVGTDVQVYARPIFEAARASRSFIGFTAAYGNEFAYYALAYIAAHATGSFAVFLFLTELAILIPISISAVIIRSKVPLTSTMLLFMLLFFPMGLNVMRQSIAVAFLMLALILYFEDMKIRALIIAVAAVLFHLSAVIGILLAVAVLMIVKIRVKGLRALVLLSVGASVTLAVVFWSQIADWLIYAVRLLPEKYSYYMNIFQNPSAVGLTVSHYFNFGIYGVVDYLFRVTGTIVPLVICCLRKSADERIVFFKYSSIISLIIYSGIFLIFHTIYGYRITIYLDYMNIFYFGSLVHKTEPVVSLRRIPADNMLLFTYAFVYWAIIYFVLRAHAVVPYSVSY